MKILITGSAGFIGMATSKAFLEKGIQVFGIDNLNSFYDKKLKTDRNKKLKKYKNYNFYKYDLCKDKRKINSLIKKNKIKIIINLAAQANVRYSLKNPDAYINSNIVGFYNILEIAKKNNIKLLIYASSSSVYGNTFRYKKFFKENDDTNNPKNLYAASKKANEVIANAYSDLFNFKCVGLRFFTVYGPWGRPDMAPFIFTNSIFKNKKINIFNSGKMFRDFTFIDDVTSAIVKITIKANKQKRNFSEIFNIGNGNKIRLMDFIKTIEKVTKITANKKYLPLQHGDMLYTRANIEKLKKFIKFYPKTNLEDGLKSFVSWFVEYYKIKK